MSTNLTKKQAGFVKDYLETGNGTQAALQNYDVNSENSAAVVASSNLRKLKIQEALANHAEDAESMIFQLSQKARNESVRLGASKDIMDRAGHKPIEKTQSLNINVDTILVKFLDAKDNTDTK